EGKSTTAANLAFVMSRAGQRVVLLDCDLRRPRLHDFFGLPNTIGFTDLLVGNASLDDVLQRVAGEENLSIITSGPIPPDPSELLSSKKARDVIEQIRGRADLVIIDSPPVLAVTDPLVLANVVDAVVLVAAAGKSDKRFTIKAMEQLQLVDAHVVGAVLNRQGSRGSDSYGYGYGYGYRSEYKSSAPSTQPASPAPSRLPIPTSASQPDAVAELDEAIARVQLPSAPTVAAGETDPTPPEIS
ncbi:MAG: CpsD/CapB family tyrosine-protein kinase, partial [Actinomycetota bacterium]